MVERICPACQHGNPLDDRFCGKCGAPLERLLPARRSDAPLTVAGHSLPVSWKQLSKTVAISVVALAAEAGLVWLRRRIEAAPATASAAAPAALARPRVVAPAQIQPVPETPAGNSVTIVSHRVIEIRDIADGAHQVIERTFWRRTEE